MKFTVYDRFLSSVPILCSLFMAFLLLFWSHAASPEVSRTAWLTVYAPLFWICLFFKNRWIILSILVAPIVLFLLDHVMLLSRHDFWNIRHSSEFVSCSWTIILAIHALWLSAGNKTTRVLAFVRYFGIAFIYGLSLESSGIGMGFFSEPGYTFYFPYLDTPLVAVSGWLTVFYPVMFLVHGLCERWPRLAQFPTLCGILCGLAALSIDIHLDPIATNLGLWIWNPKLQTFFHGVPLLNFSSWFFAVATFSIACFWIDRTIQRPWLREGALLIAVPVVQSAAGILNFGSVFVLEGPESPALGIFRNYLGLSF